MKEILKRIKKGELNMDNDESGAGGFWDLSYEIYGEIVKDNKQQELVERIYHSLWDIVNNI